MKTRLFDIDLDGYQVKVFGAMKNDLPEGRVGQFNPETYEMVMRTDRNLGGFAEAETALHELVHAIAATALSPQEDLTENQVLRLGFGLANALKRNPQFRRYLWDRLK